MPQGQSSGTEAAVATIADKSSGMSLKPLSAKTNSISQDFHVQSDLGEWGGNADVRCRAAPPSQRSAPASRRESAVLTSSEPAAPAVSNPSAPDPGPGFQSLCDPSALLPSSILTTSISLTMGYSLAQLAIKVTGLTPAWLKAKNVGGSDSHPMQLDKGNGRTDNQFQASRAHQTSQSL